MNNCWTSTEVVKPSWALKKKKLFFGKPSTTGTTNLSTTEIQIPIDLPVFQIPICWCHGSLTHWTSVQTMGNLGLLSTSVKINRWSYWLQCIVAFVTAIRECHNCLGSVSLESECSWPLHHIFSAMLLLALHVCFATGHTHDLTFYMISSGWRPSELIHYPTVDD